jgi:hypothetical protein
VGVTAGPGEGGELGQCTQALGAEPDSELIRVWRAGPGEGRFHVRVGVDPTALPQCQLGQVQVVDALAPVLAQRREGGFEVCLG